ncbi:hypothetical protein D3C76_655630 [compost metagenome]
MIALPDQFTRQYINLSDSFNFVTEQFDPNGMLTLRCRENLNHITTYTEGSAYKIDIITLVLDIH